jgi:Sulfatase
MSATEAPARQAAEPRSTRRREWLWDGAHLAVLWTFAVAQPLFDLLKDNPEFFAARGSSGFDVISWSVLLVVLPPLLLMGVEALAGLAGHRVRKIVHGVLIGALVTLIAAQALKKAIDASDAVLIVLSIAIGAGLAVLYMRTEPVRSFMSVLSPAPIVFLCLFLFTQPISKLAFPEEAGARTIGGVTRTPIVVVLFDELPSLSLWDDHGHVDPKRYPGFAELASRSTWFRNAYTIYDSTERAQPAIFDGDYPAKDKLPTSSDHPNSIFSLFGKTHRMHVSEEATSVCSRKLCKDARLQEPWTSRMRSMTDDLGLVWLHVVLPPKMENNLASVSENWGNFGGSDDGGSSGGGSGSSGISAAQVRGNLNANRSRRFKAWIDTIHVGGKPELDFKHALLPHVPWQYLPSGARNRKTPNDAIPGLSNQSYEDQGQRDQLYQRHLLQLGFADLLLQELWAKLKQEGIYDKAVIVVAADHGVALNLPRRDRRRLRRDTVGEIASIPFFIHAPGQEKGKIDDAYAESVDILPTIFDVLNLDPKVHMDGSSAFGPRVQQRHELRMFERGTFKPLRMSTEEFQRQRRITVERKLRLFGTGADGPDRIYRIGPHQELLGKSVDELSPAPQGSVKVDVQDSGDYENVEDLATFVPNHVVAKVEGGSSGATRDIAVAVNGKIEAVSKTFYLATDSGQEVLSAMVPPDAFHEGANKVEIFEVGSGGELTRLGGA